MQDFSLTNNWSSWDSKIRIPPLEPTSLHSFFESEASGPYKLERYQGKVASFATLAGSLHDRMMCGRNVEAVQSEVERAKVKLSEMTQQKKRALMNSARDKAKVTLANKKQKREVHATPASA